MTTLSGKVAIVTGASKGIGAGIALALSEAGAAVVVNYASGKSGAEAIVKSIQEKGGTAIAIQADVSKAEDIARLFQDSKKAFGSLDILINNAGVFQFDALENFTESEFHREFNINVLGLLLASRESLKYFSEQGGSIINISSVATQSTPPSSVVYTETKGAVDAATRVLAKELAPKNIRVNSINPGMIETEGVHRLGIIGSDFERDIVQKTPLGRRGHPDDISPIAVFLASDAARWITGEIVVASGGFH